MGGRKKKFYEFNGIKNRTERKKKLVTKSIYIHIYIDFVVLFFAFSSLSIDIILLAANMRNIIQLTIILTFLILTFVTIVGESRFVPRPEKVHFGSVTFPRRWGSWCSNDIDCGLGYCRAYMCECYRGYISWYYMEPCAYEQRSKLTAFLVSFFVGILGIDWFYLSRGNGGYIVAGIIKLLISCGCLFGWPFLYATGTKKSRNYIITGNVINGILTAISLIWWLTDWIRILADTFHDGHGAPLKPWGYDYFYNNRIPYRY
jgi:hypothetical protein